MIYLSILSYRHKLSFLHELIVFLIFTDSVTFLTKGFYYIFTRIKADLSVLETTLFFIKAPFVFFMYYFYFRFIMSIYKPKDSKYVAYFILVTIGLLAIPLVLAFTYNLNLHTDGIYNLMRLICFILGILFIQTTVFLIALGYKTKRKSSLSFYYLFALYFDLYFILFILRLLNLFGFSETEIYTEKLLLVLQIPIAIFVGIGLMKNLFISQPLVQQYSNLQLLQTNYSLTKREIEVIHCIIESMSNKDIAENLHISVSTANRHIYNIYKKMDVNNKMQLLKKLNS